MDLAHETLFCFHLYLVITYFTSMHPCTVQLTALCVPGSPLPPLFKVLA
jgi:hypothetical protein